MNFSIVNFNKLVIYAVKISPHQGFDAPPPLRDSTPCRPKGSLFVLFWDIYIWWRTKNFLKAPSAPINSNIEGGGARAKKMRFFVKIFQKVAKNSFFGLFFSNLPAAQKFLPKQQNLFSALEELGKSICRPKKKSTKFSKIRKKNLKIPPSPPRENPRSLIVPTTGNGKQLCHQPRFVFFFFVKSGTTKK